MAVSEKCTIVWYMYIVRLLFFSIREKVLDKQHKVYEKQDTEATTIIPSRWQSCLIKTIHICVQVYVKMFCFILQNNAFNDGSITRTKGR